MLFYSLSTQLINQVSSLLSKSSSSWLRKTSCLPPWSLPLPALVRIFYFSFLIHSSFLNFKFLKKNSGVTMVNAQDCARNYTVQPGDVCDKISAAQNVSTYVSISYSYFLFFFKVSDFFMITQIPISDCERKDHRPCLRQLTSW